MAKFKKISFKPTQNPNEAQYMMIYGRPFVHFWEIHIIPRLNKNKIKVYKIWEISLDSVPLLRLYRLKSDALNLKGPNQE